MFGLSPLLVVDEDIVAACSCTAKNNKKKNLLPEGVGNLKKS